MATSDIAPADAGRKLIFIYGLIDPRDGRIRYIGKTNDLAQRFRAHLSDGRYKRGLKNDWIKDLRKKGLTPRPEVLETVPFEDWVAAEMRWIAKGRAEGWSLFNLTDGGEDIPPIFSTEEIRNRAAEARKSSPRWIAANKAAGLRRRGISIDPEIAQRRTEGVRAVLAGVPLSTEHREKIRQANKGKQPSAASIAATRAKKTGVPLSEQHRQKIGEASRRNRGILSEKQAANWADPEYRARVRANMGGKPLPDEVKAKIGAHTKSAWQDPDHKAKRSASIRAGMASEEYRAKRAEMTRRQWADPEFRERMKRKREQKQ